jgi:hypothetical protein
MTQHSRQASLLTNLQKAPKRLTVTVPFAILHELIERSCYEGRSISNLAAFILEQGLMLKR